METALTYKHYQFLYNTLSNDELKAAILTMCPSVDPTTKISNLTRKVLRYLDNGGNPDHLVPLHKQTEPAFFDLPGLGVDMLLSTDFLSTSTTYPRELINHEFVYELEKLRRKHSLHRGWSAAIVEKLIGENSHNELALQNRFSNTFDKCTKLYKKRKSAELKEFFKAVFIMPISLFTKLSDDTPIKPKCTLTSDDTATIDMVVAERDTALQVREKEFLQKEAVLAEKVKSHDCELEKKKEMMKFLHVTIKELKEHNCKLTPRNVRRRQMTLKTKLKEEKQNVKEMNQVLTDLRHQNEMLSDQNNCLRRDKVALQKKNSKIRIKGMRKEESENVTNLKDKLTVIENENEILKERVDELLEDNEIKMFHNGKYTDECRLVYMEMLSQGVSSQKCSAVIHTVLKNLATVTHDRLPGHSLSADLRNEASVVAKIQCDVKILDGTKNTIHIDGTKKRFREFSSVDITTDTGEGLSVGFDEMSGGTADDYLASTVGILAEIAELLVPQTSTKLEKDTKLGEILTKIRNTMTDRHVVNKVFNERFYDIRQNYMTLVRRDMEDMTQEEIHEVLNMNNLFCSAHVLANCGTTAKSSLRDFEVMCGLSDNGKETARTFSFLYALSKATSYGHDYQKAGVALHWTSYLESIGAKNKVVCMKGERINVIFVGLLFTTVTTRQHL